MGAKTEEVSKKTGFSPEVLKVVAAKAGLDENAEGYVRKLTDTAKTNLSEKSVEEYKLKTISEVLGAGHDDVLKASIASGARLSKDAGGEFWVVGQGLITLVNTLYGKCEEPAHAPGKPRDKKADRGSEQDTAKVKKKKPEKEVVMEQMNLNDIFSENTENKPVSENKEKNSSVKEKADESILEEKKKMPVKSSKNSKAVLKTMISGGTEMDASKARKFLIQSKLKKLEEVAYMSDAEVSKIVNKDYAFINVSNDTASVSIAVPKEELKKIDLSKVAVL